MCIRDRYEEYGETGTKQFEVTGHDGVFLVRPDDIDAYLEKFKPMQLREKRTVKVNDAYAVINMGEAKGLTYDLSLIHIYFRRWRVRKSYIPSRLFIC